jgi:hypothetical protein
VNPIDLENLAELRIKQAHILMVAGSYPGSYAVECALKACIAKQVRPHDFPDKPEQIRQIYSHDLKRLHKAAKLEDQLEQDMRSNNHLRVPWNRVVDWNEERR